MRTIVTAAAILTGVLVFSLFVDLYAELHVERKARGALEEVHRKEEARIEALRTRVREEQENEQAALGRFATQLCRITAARENKNVTSERLCAENPDGGETCIACGQPFGPIEPIFCPHLVDAPSR